MSSSITSSTGAHLLNLKVLRLSKPSFSIKGDLNYADNLFKASTSHVLEDASDGAISNILELPMAFGNIYLGETFTSYLSINNDSATAVNDVAFKAELQTSSQRFTLVDTIGATPTNSTELLISQQKAIANQVSLLPRQSAEFLFDHEIKELGIHILVCSAHYTPANAAPQRPGVPDTQRKFFRKFFKFQVLNPISVKTKVNNIPGGKVSLEIQIQNLAAVPLCLENVGFQPNEVFTWTELNDHQDFSNNIMAPQDIRQYLYILSPSSSNDLTCRITPNLGRLDINWRSTFGQAGHLQTSQLVRKVPTINPFEVVVLEVPPRVIVEKPFKLKLRIKNNLSGERLRLSIKGVKSKMTNILLRGSNEVDLGVLDGQTHCDFDMEFLPILTGLHPLSGFIISEKISGALVDLDNLAMIKILPPVA